MADANVGLSWNEGNGLPGMRGMPDEELTFLRSSSGNSRSRDGAAKSKL